MSKYGSAPIDLGEVDVSLPEVMYYLYLPVKLAGHRFSVIPKNLRPLIPLLWEVFVDMTKEEWEQSYIYLTVKKMFVSPSVTANRPGWHADGFGTEDMNYIWYDCLPTEFSEGHFDITDGDHVKSLEEFEAQAPHHPISTYPNKHLLKLDSSVVHRVAAAKEQMMRTFVKISVSKDKYNLKDNSINHELDYRWKTYDRAIVRNDPSMAQRDSFPPTPQDDHFA